MPSTDSPGHDAEQPPSVLETFREQVARFVSGLEQFWDGLTFEYNGHVRAGYKRLGITCLILQWILNTLNWLAPQCNIVNHLFYPTVLLYRYLRPQPWDDIFMNTVRQLGCAERTDIVAKPVPRALRQLQGYLVRTLKAYVAIGAIHALNNMPYVPPFMFLNLLAMYAYLRSKSFQQPGLVIVIATALMGFKKSTRVFEMVVLQQYFVNELLQPYLARVQFKAWEQRAWFQANDVELLGFGFGAWMICSVPLVGVAALPLMFAITAVLLSRSCGVMENSGQGLLLAAYRGHQPKAGGGKDKTTPKHKDDQLPDLARDSLRDVAEGKHPSVLGDWDALEVKTLSAGAPGKEEFISAPREHTRSKLTFHAKVKGIKMPITADQVAHDQRYALENPPVLDPTYGLPPGQFMPWGGGFGLGPGLGRFPMMPPPPPPAMFGVPPPAPPVPSGAVPPPQPVHPTAASKQPSASPSSEAQNDGPTSPLPKVADPTAPLPPQQPAPSSSSISSMKQEPSAPPLTPTAPSSGETDTKAPISSHPEASSGASTSTTTPSGWLDPKAADETVTVTPRGLEDLTRYNFSDRKTLETAPSAPPPPSESSSRPLTHTGPPFTSDQHSQPPHQYPMHSSFDGQHYGGPHPPPFHPSTTAQPHPSNWAFGPEYGVGSAGAGPSSVHSTSSSGGSGGGGGGPMSPYDANAMQHQYAGSLQAWQAWQSKMQAEYQRQLEKQQRKMAKQQRKEAERQRKEAEQRRKAAQKEQLQRQKQVLQQQQRLQQLNQQKQQLQQQQQQQQGSTSKTRDLQAEMDRVASKIDAISKELELLARAEEEAKAEEDEQDEDEAGEEEEEEEDEGRQLMSEEEYTEDEDDGRHGPASRFWGRGGHGPGYWGGGRGSWGRGWQRGGGAHSWGRGGRGDRRDRSDSWSRGGWGAYQWVPPVGAFPGNYGFPSSGASSTSLPGSTTSSSSAPASSSSQHDVHEIPPTPPPKDRAVPPSFSSPSLSAQSSSSSSKSGSSKSKSKGSSSKEKKKPSWKEQVELSPPVGNPFENGLTDTLSRNMSRIEDRINERMEHAADKWVKRLQRTAVQAGEAALTNAMSTAMSSLPNVIKDSLNNAMDPNPSSSSSSVSSSARGSTKRR
ncbi:hypothetical protein BGZ73_000878 [Actinomortierella ambigua]|nr:hypothetical protein BGZ73_000878 [Actinomortierella ambigua]